MGKTRIGRRSYYRPKDKEPLSIILTSTAKDLLQHTVFRTGASRGDVVEQLVRRFGAQVTFDGMTTTE